MKLQTRPSFFIFIFRSTGNQTMHKPRTSPPNPYSRPFANSIDEDGTITHGDRYSEVQFTPLPHRLAAESDGSGVISPPLWGNSPSPPRSPSRPLLGHHHQPYSPDSRAQAIARGRSELMEMVRHMPESSYELSLKDIVEHHHRAENQIPKTEDKGGSDQRAAVAVGSKKEQSNNFDRKSSFENRGLFLNMAFPFSFKSRKKKRNIGSNSGRISPKPEGLKGGGERDWWKKKFTGSSDSDSSRTSGSSSVATASSSSSATTGGGGRSRDHDRGRRKSGCWHLFHLRRSKSA